MEAESPYRKLDVEQKEIRVLILEPGLRSSNEKLKCSLQITSLFSPVEYETISYCWGNISLSSEILMHNRITTVPRSSEEALRRMLLPDRSRTLWIDALCIDQQNIPERSQQVAMMGEVYRFGVRNLIYLGKEDESTSPALESIQLLINTEIADAIQGGKSLVDTIYDASGDESQATSGLTVPVDLNAIANLLSRPWFKEVQRLFGARVIANACSSRLWVVQEVAQSSENMCHCGDAKFDLLSLAMAVLWLWYKFDYLQQPSMRLLGCLRTTRWMFEYLRNEHSLWQHQKPNLLDILFIGQRFSCSDPRDTIYAVMGLLSWRVESIPSTLVADYSLATWEVYTRAACYVLGKFNGPEPLLSIVSPRTTSSIRTESLPSWVPSWNLPLDATFDAALFRYDINSAKTLPESSIPSDLAEVAQSGRLRLQGLTLGTVEKVSACCENVHAFKEFYESYIIPFEDQNGELDFGSDSSMCHILTGGRVDGRPLDQEEVNLIQHFMSECKERWDGMENDELQSIPSISIQSHQNLWMAILTACSHRRLCTIQQHGPLCLATELTQPGDIVVQLIGAYTPSMLRSSEDGYIYLGQAYMHGLMDGEVAQAVNEKRFEPAVFTLI